MGGSLIRSVWRIYIYMLGLHLIFDSQKLTNYAVRLSVAPTIPKDSGKLIITSTDKPRFQHGSEFASACISRQCQEALELVANALYFLLSSATEPPQPLTIAKRLCKSTPKA